MGPKARTRGAGALCALALLSLLALAPQALAGPPTHLRNEALDIAGLDHACGVAVDSKGDVYASSAGESKIKVFDPAHAELTSIANPNEPCGLAVNSKGELFVSEVKTGNVIRYKPNAYPFSGTLSYGPAEPIDTSGKAKGISIDRFDDRLYVARGDRLAVYKPDGSAESPSNEVQVVHLGGCSAGTYTLSFRGQATAPLAFNATSAQLDAALEALGMIGTGNVAVTEEPPSSSEVSHKVSFEGALLNKTLPQIGDDGSKLTCSGSGLFITTLTQGFSGNVGEGSLTDATGVAAYTYKRSGETGDRYIFAADAAAGAVKVFGGPDVKQIEARQTIRGVDQDRDPNTPDQELGFEAAGAYLAVDPGNRSATDKCASVAEQACTAGHLLVYDASHDAVDELEASGQFLDQLSDPSLADAKPTALAVERSGGPNDGAIYVSSGSGASAKLLAFGSLATPSRAALDPLSHVLETARGVATDSHGDVYVGAQSVIHVYDPSGTEVKTIEDPEVPLKELAIDSACNVYVLEGTEAEEKVTYYDPSACPPAAGTTYTRHAPIASSAEFPSDSKSLRGIAVNPGPGPGKDHLVVASNGNTTREYDGAAKGSGFLRCFACGLSTSSTKESIAVDGASGKVYFGVNGGEIFVVDPTGQEFVARITGAGCAGGPLTGNPKLAIDQASGHLLVFRINQGAVREYDASGACVGEFGQFAKLNATQTRIAVDSSCALHEPPLTATTTPTCEQFDPANGNLYVAFDDPGNVTHPFDVTALGPLAYGEPPLAETGAAGAVEGGNATASGTVDPNGFDLAECKFEYLTDAQFLANGKAFAGATSQTCAEELKAIGKGDDPVPVHVDLAGLDPDARYRFRLVAKNKYGESQGDAGLFGPPLLTAKSALPVLYHEATLRAEVDPSGLSTEYHFEFLSEAEFQESGFAGAQSTPAVKLPAADGPVAVQAPLTGLAEGATYHFRVFATNEAKAVEGPDQTLTTLARRPTEECPNVAFRAGLSANLPECRAYELVTPAETNGLSPGAIDSGTAGTQFNNWLATPRGPGAGERLSYFTPGTLPGFDGSGRIDGYRAERGEGEHPAQGWQSELFGPSFEQSAPGILHLAKQQGVSADQLYSFWKMEPEESFAGTLPGGIYLRTPAGFEVAGQGSLGTDLDATSQFVSAGGAHVIFSSDAQLEPGAAPEGSEAIYDRAAGASDASVVSLLPDDIIPTGSSAFVGISEDGSTTLFSRAGRLFARFEDSRTVGVPDVALGGAIACAAGPGTATLAYRWLRDGAPIPAATDPTYTPTAADAGALLQCEVSATSAEGGGLASSAALVVSPFPDSSPPLALGGPTISGTRNVGQTLTCNPGSWEAGPSFAYQWYRNGAPIPGASASTYLLSAAEKGAAVQCALTASNAGGAALLYTSPALIGALPPTATANPTISGTKAVGQTLTCSPGTWANGPAFAYEWLRNGAPIPAANASTYLVTVADEGKALQCRVSATNADATAKAVSAAAVIPPAPATTPPLQSSPGTVSGTATVGQTLTCSPGTWSGAPAFAFQWLRNGAPIAAATEAAYTLQGVDRQTSVQCQVTATNAGGAALAIEAGSGARYVDPNPPPASASAPSGATFAGVSEDGSRLLYTNAADGAKPGQLFALDLGSGTATQIAPESVFVNVSPDGSQAFFTSKAALTGAEQNEAGEEAEAGEDNLYAWDAGSEATHFIAQLAPQDFVSFAGLKVNTGMNLGQWTRAINAGVFIGRAQSPTRSTPGGEVLAFQSHARLTAYDNEGHGEIYRYDPTAPSGERLLCVSCDPSGAPASADDLLQDTSNVATGVIDQSVIANLTDDGEAVFFQSFDRLLPEDSNDVLDVYEWRARGAGSCERAGGCLALISSGQGDTHAFLYAMSADGHDVFFRTREKLLGDDIPGSPSIYDARVDGGIPDPPAPEPCQGDACQGQGSTPPTLGTPASTGSDEDEFKEEPKARCAKGKRRVRDRCIRPHKKRHHKRSHRRAGRNRGAGR